ncbi:MAG: HPr family phosphocarrier protein [Nocardioidaceae bacterium]|nr:HPr family phosphocarrier protein [Nocardioidaceae bacterium]
MIGIVVVSHSRPLANAAVALASEMVDATDLPRIATAAGLDEATFGTDAAAVADAVGAVDSPDGVLVLVDLGSAIMSAEMALEFLDPALAERVVISSAPLVEGLVAAVVLASTGAALAAVAVEAQAGLAAKQSHLQHAETPAAERADHGDAAAVCESPEKEAAPPDEGGAVSIEINIAMVHGLHARPAAKLVSLVRRFDASVSLAHLSDGPPSRRSDAASLSQVATLNARRGDRLLVTATGSEAREALAAVAELASREFGEAATSSADGVTANPLGRSGAGDGASASTGSGLDMAVGPALVLEMEVDTSGYMPGETAREAARSVAAVDAVAKALTALRAETARRIGLAEAEIFDAHLALLSDPDLLDPVKAGIAVGNSAIEAWQRRLTEVAARFEALDDAYQRERVQDVRSVERRLLSELLRAGAADAHATAADAHATAAGDHSTGVATAVAGGGEGAAEGPGIVVVPELDAATAATLDVEQVTGIVTRQGGATGHGIIVAKSRGIPVLTDAGERLDTVRQGTVVGFDGRTGQLWISPDDEQVTRIRAEIESRRQNRRVAVQTARQPAVTRDGCRITVTANVTSVDDAVAGLANGAEGSGLVRTEVLFGAMRTPPSVEEQTQQFLAIAAAMDGQPITIRTWDVGGDKPLRFLPQPEEANPFLGERGLRLFRRQPGVLVDQLQAVCRAARETPVQVMFPMVSCPAEVAWALDCLAQAASRDGVGVPDGLHVGVMIEIPAAALAAGRIAADLDFVSIGTNDLTQYTMAAERGNAALTHLVQALDPSVLRLVKLVCDEVPPAVEVAVCGDVASSPTSAILLAGLGVRELSVVGPAVPEVKSALRRTSLSHAEALGRQALQAGTADEVKSLLVSLLTDREARA